MFKFAKTAATVCVLLVASAALSNCGTSIGQVTQSVQQIAADVRDAVRAGCSFVIDEQDAINLVASFGTSVPVGTIAAAVCDKLHQAGVTATRGGTRTVVVHGVTVRATSAARSGRRH